MKIISRFVNFLAVIVVSLTATAFVLDSTILNVKFTSEAAKQSGFFDDLATTLPELMTGSLQGREQTDAKLALSYVLTPGYIGRQWESLSIGWDKHYRTRSPLPKLELSDISTQATAAGFKLPPEVTRDFDRPTALQEIPMLAGLYSAVHLLKLFGIPLSLILLAAAWAAARGNHFMALAKVFTGSAVGLATTWVVFAAAPGLVTASLSSNQDLKFLAGPVTKFLQAIFTATNQKLLMVIIGFVAAAAVCAILSIISKLFGRGGGGHGGIKRPIQRFHPADKQ